MFEIIFTQICNFITFVLSVCYWTTPNNSTEDHPDSIPAYIFTDEDIHKGKLAIKRLKQKQLVEKVKKDVEQTPKIDYIF
jgi:hypothetical protein